MRANIFPSSSFLPLFLLPRKAAIKYLYKKINRYVSNGDMIDTSDFLRYTSYSNIGKLFIKAEEGG